MEQWLWTQKQDISPAQRYSHAMAYDGGHKVVVLFGGEASNFELLNDTWTWDGQLWTQVADTGPVKRSHHTMSFDVRLGLSVTYRRQGRILEAIEPMRNDPSAEELIFFVLAWKAAFAKAQSLGWLY